MPFSAYSSLSFSYLLFLGVFTYSGFINSESLADDISLERLSINSSQNVSTSNKIDWSKPIVSRGFGLTESQAETDQGLLTQYQSGQVFYFFGEYAKAVDKWLPLLDQNFPEAQASMGWLYQMGVGVERNEGKAFQLYLKAAKSDNAIAQNNLGVMYENGITVEKSLQQASDWYKKSAEQGYRFGQFNYANMLLETMEKKLDDSNVSQPAKSAVSIIDEAKRFLKMSADQGVVQAKIKLDALS